MTIFKNRLKTAEELELEHKYLRLAQVKAELQRREQDYTTLKTEIRSFEQLYEDVLGVRIEALEELEWQLKGLLGETTADTTPESSEQPYSFPHFQHTTDLLDDVELPHDAANLTLKSLYRGVAKAVHPDLAVDERERLRRQELMALANDAYQTGNRQVLIDLLSEWEQTPELCASGMDIALELVRVTRQIAAVRLNIHAIIRQNEELKQTDIYHFKLRVEDELADGGVDLLVEMAAAVDLNIARIRSRLATILGTECEPTEARAAQFKSRMVRFPAAQNCGTLFVRKIASADFRDWQSIGAAQGTKEIFLDTSLRLDVKAVSGMDTNFLRELQPNDLHSLFLYNCDDAIIAQMTHLSGLQELYFSDTSISDLGLSLLQPLLSLQRLSIYHTAISDTGLLNLAQLPGLKWLTCSGISATEEGVALFRKVMPGCKTVNFTWRY
jgi:hypothetical protein